MKNGKATLGFRMYKIWQILKYFIKQKLFFSDEYTVESDSGKMRHFAAHCSCINYIIFQRIGPLEFSAIGSSFRTPPRVTNSVLQSAQCALFAKKCNKKVIFSVKKKLCAPFSSKLIVTLTPPPKLFSTNLEHSRRQKFFP